MVLVRDNNGFHIQAFPLTAGKINITTGTITSVSAICCVSDGSIVLNTYGVTVPMIAGDVFSCADQSVTVSSGTFHLA